MGRRSRGRNAATVVAAVLGALLASGCSGPPDRPAAPRAASVEGLAAAAGCAPSVQTRGGHLRLGTCLTARGSYVLATFPDRTAMRAWLAESQAYEGPYLVGERWVVAGPAAALRPVQRRWGGALESNVVYGR